MLNVNVYDKLCIGLASADQIRGWSYDEVKKPETINYCTLKSERDGLFCEKVFGPTRGWEYYCSKYKRVRFKGIICERRGAEMACSNVRRERMGYIKLAASVTHIWCFKGVPSRLGYLLNITPKDLGKVIYFAAHMITYVDEEAHCHDLPSLQARHKTYIKQLKKGRDSEVGARLVELEEDPAQLESEGAKADIKHKVSDGAQKETGQLHNQYQRRIDRAQVVWERFKPLKVQGLEGDEILYRGIKQRYGKYFTGYMGAEVIKKRLETPGLQGEAEKLRETITNGEGQYRTRALRRLKVAVTFLSGNNNPSGMVLDAIPVIPPDLRPMVQLNGGRFVTSDLDDLYRHIINHNNRLKRFLDLGTLEIIVDNERRMLQEIADSLFDNGHRSRPAAGPGNRPLKSISDMFKGKQGRFRQNLLGKCVDYSDHSVVMVGPQLKLHQCGLPKVIALKLFRPLVMERLGGLDHAQNIEVVKRMVERQRPVVWDVPEETTAEHPVLLNCTLTLHRLGIQAFEPQLIEDRATQLHPLVCTALNADFDSDQMAVHLSLSAKAQAEARVPMLSTNNTLKLVDGRLVTVPSHEVIIDTYWLTMLQEQGKGVGRTFSSVAEAIMAHDRGDLHVGAPIKLRLSGITPPAGYAGRVRTGGSIILETSLGRALFNEVLPANFPFVNERVGKKQIGRIINGLTEHYPLIDIVRIPDRLKNLGFQWGLRSGVTVLIADVQAPPSKPEISAAYDVRTAKIDTLHERDSVTKDERRQELIELRTDATTELTDATKNDFSQTNPIFVIIDSDARGSMTQTRQIVTMRGPMTDPKGDITARPIESNFREGLSVLEYSISTHGGRKRQADMALWTADLSYLTRRLVDVSQDIIIREEGCQTGRGLIRTITRWTEIVTDEDDRKTQVAVEPLEEGASVSIVPDVEAAVYVRTVAMDITNTQSSVFVAAGTDPDGAEIERFAFVGITRVKVRFVLTCEITTSICTMCYDRPLTSGKTVDVGGAVGIVAAQSTSEPDTQLTIRTFHTGGVAGDDVTQGLPRATELLEARRPGGKAPIAEANGAIRIEDDNRSRKIITVRDDDDGDLEYLVTRRTRLEFEDTNGVCVAIRDGMYVTIGQQLITGQVDLQDMLRIRGLRKVQGHLIEEVQRVYRTQGAPIYDKRIEITIRQMLRYMIVIGSGGTSMMLGELADRQAYEAASRKALVEGGRPAERRLVLVGITKVSLATGSWLSAVSFQEMTKVLTGVAIQDKPDTLVGLKENVTPDGLIPTGTDLERYRSIRMEPIADARSQAYTVGYDPYDYLFSSGLDVPGVPLDDVDFGDIR